MITENSTIAEAKAYFSEQADKGFICPCCTRLAKVYRRPLTAAMAAGLILLYKENFSNANEYIHLENFFKNIPYIPSSIRGDIPKLRFWNLIEAKPGQREDGNPNNGFYKITKDGINFVELRIVVYSHVRIYDNRFLGYPKDAKLINISEALKQKFDYIKLMQA